VDDLAGYDVLIGLDVRGLLEDFPVDRPRSACATSRRRGRPGG